MSSLAWFALLFFAVMALARLGRKRPQSVAVSAPTAGLVQTRRQPQYRLTYRDSAGVVTVREVSVQGFAATDDGFDAWCFERRAVRSFRFDRLVELVDCSTGEVLRIYQLYAALHPGKTIPLDIAFCDALPLTYALMAFGRQVLGRLDERRKQAIAQAIHECVGVEQIPMSQVVHWFTSILPNAQLLYEPVEHHAALLRGADRALARRAALAMVQGAGRTRPSAERLAEVDRLFPE